MIHNNILLLKAPVGITILSEMSCIIINYFSQLERETETERQWRRTDNRGPDPPGCADMPVPSTPRPSRAWQRAGRCLSEWLCRRAQVTASHRHFPGVQAQSGGPVAREDGDMAGVMRGVGERQLEGREPVY